MNFVSRHLRLASALWLAGGAGAGDRLRETGHHANGLLMATADSASGVPACEPNKIFAQTVADECGPSPGKGTTLDWTAFVGELYEARNLLFQAGPELARMQLANLMRLATQRGPTAFECPAAVAATSYALAEVIAAEGDTQGHSLALLQFALALLPSAAHRECTQWPMKGRDLEAAFLKLLETSRPAPLLPQQLPPADSLRIAVVTACAGFHPGRARQSSEENLRSYTSRHGYDLHFFPDASAVMSGAPAWGWNQTQMDAPAFWRAHALQRVIDSEVPYHWILWVDCEVALTDLERSVPVVLASHGISPAEVTGGGPEAADLLLTADGLGAKPEVMFLRRSPWSLSFVQRWARSPASAFNRAAHDPNGRHEERLALQHSVLPHWEVWLAGNSWPNWESFAWPTEVRLAAGNLLGARSECC
ncbi:unnamed protein product [Polarella glacialis]|uniref:Uncharacterized protein n=1 Tax=Polarella glacialis TaxID=89957 RepID=A0A813F0R3_POLGL|nr:unnamed protein product [Polarella glacialis]